MINLSPNYENSLGFDDVLMQKHKPKPKPELKFHFCVMFLMIYTKDRLTLILDMCLRIAIAYGLILRSKTKKAQVEDCPSPIKES